MIKFLSGGYIVFSCFTLISLNYTKFQMESRENVLSLLKYWISVGETLQKDLASKFYKLFPSSSHTLYNLFGTTEHCEFLLHKVTESDLNSETHVIPLGIV